MKSNKKTILGVISVCLLSVTHLWAQPLPGVALSNPGFESGIENWVLTGEGTTNSVSDSLSGFLALRLQRIGIGGLRLEQNIPDGKLKPGNRLVVKVWVKPQIGCDARVILGVSVGGTEEIIYDTLTAPGGWQLLTISMDVPVDTQNAVTFLQADGTSVDFVVDDFSAYTWPDVWWHKMFSAGFDGHGHYTVPHLDTLDPTVSSMAATGYHGLWDVDSERDQTWSHYSTFQARPDVKPLIYIEGATSRSMLCRTDSTKKITLTGNVFHLLNSASQWALNNFNIGNGDTIWFGDWEFMTQPANYSYKTRLGNPLPTPTEMGLDPFTHPLDGSPITSKDQYWQTRSGRPLFETPLDPGQTDATWMAFNNPALYPDLEPYTEKNGNNELLIITGESTLLYDEQYARYHAATGRRAMDVLGAGMIHYDDWNLMGPGYNSADADIYVAAFRAFVQANWTEAQCAQYGFTLATVDQFDVVDYLKNPPWRGEYDPGNGGNWWAAADDRWLSNLVWRSFQIAGLEDRRSAMELIYQLNKQNAIEVAGQDIPMVTNIIPTLGVAMDQFNMVDMSNFEWPMQKTYGSFPTPLGYYPQSRPGIGPRMAAKITTTGHTMVNPYVEPQYCGWDGNGYTSRNYETLHKILYFDLIANRGVPNFALTFDGMYSPGSIYSAGELHTFINGDVGELLSKREYIADIGLAASGWSHIAPQPIFGGWAHTHTLPRDRYMSELIGWSEFLARSTDFPQWDYLTFDDVTLDDLARFKLVLLPSVLVVTQSHIDVLTEYLNIGGRLLITGETGTYDGPEDLLMPHAQDIIAPLETAYPGQIVRTASMPGFNYQTNPGTTEEQALQTLLDSAATYSPVLTDVGAPQHIGIFLNKSLSNPDEITVDMVNYNYSLATDTLTPVPASFDIQLDLNHFSNGDAVSVETINYDEASADNQTVQTLDAASISWSGDTLIVQAPPFVHYQVLRITLDHSVCMNPPVGDLSGDCNVTIEDFALFADDWLRNQCILAGDLSGNCEVDFEDYSILANEWD